MHTQCVPMCALGSKVTQSRWCAQLCYALASPPALAGLCTARRASASSADGSLCPPAARAGQDQAAVLSHTVLQGPHPRLQEVRRCAPVRFSLLAPRAPRVCVAPERLIAAKSCAESSPSRHHASQEQGQPVREHVTHQD